MLGGVSSFPDVVSASTSQESSTRPEMHGSGRGWAGPPCGGAVGLACLLWTPRFTLRELLDLVSEEDWFVGHL